MSALSFELFEYINDPRETIKIKHKLTDALSIVVCAVMGGAETYEDIEFFGRSKEAWLKQYLELKNGIPSHDTFRRIMMLIDPDEFEDLFFNWVQNHFRFQNKTPDHVAIDGKTMRRSFDRTKGLAPIHIVNAYSTKNKLVLTQKRVEDKKGEKTVLPELIQALDLENILVSIDAGGCYVDIATHIQDKKGEYLLALKGNQHHLHKDIKSYFEQNIFVNRPDYRPSSDTFDDSHGRRVRRRVFVHEDMSISPHLGLWPNPSKVLAVETIRSKKNETDVSIDFRYYITNSKRSHAELADSIRNHWAIENSLHWVLDMTFNEDYCRIRHRNEAMNMALIRKFVLNLVRKDPNKGSIKGKLKKASWSNDYILELLSFV